MILSESQIRIHQRQVHSEILQLQVIYSRCSNTGPYLFLLATVSLALHKQLNHLKVGHNVLL